MSEQVDVVAHIGAKPRRRGFRAIRARKLCGRYDLFADISHFQKVIFVEKWTTLAALEKHGPIRAS